MWIFTQSGFASAVQSKDNPSMLVVRFRVEKDAKSFGKRLNAVPVLTPERDYRWRIVVSKIKFRRFLAKMVNELDYTNFKDRIHTQGNTRRNQAYMEVWGNMHDLQEDSIPIPGGRVKFGWCRSDL